MLYIPVYENILQIFNCQIKRRGRRWRLLVLSVQVYYSSVLLKTCDYVNPRVPYRLCLVSEERARGSTQGLSSGHLTSRQIRGTQLAPHAWLAHDPAGWDLCVWVMYSPVTHLPSDGRVTIIRWHMKEHQIQCHTAVPLLEIPPSQMNWLTFWLTYYYYQIPFCFALNVN